MNHQVLEAIHSLYESSDSSHQKEAQQWLFEFQKTTEAWQVAFLLLDSRQQNSTNLKFFGAHTLQIKISRDWETLPFDSHSEFRDALVKHLLRLSNSPESVVKRKLCLAFVTLIIKMADEWQDCIPSLLDVYLKPSDPQILDTLLEVLTLLPEECCKPGLSNNPKASKLHSELILNSPSVLKFLQQCINSQNPPIMKKSARCLQSWIVFGIPVRILADTVSSVFGLLSFDDCVEEAIDVLVELLNHKQSSHFEHSICGTILGNITTGPFRERFEKAYLENDENFVASVVKILVSFGETFSSHVLNNFQSASVTGMIDMLLKCSCYPGYYAVDEEISDKSLSFWYILQESISDSCYPSDIDLRPRMSMDSIKTIDSGSSTDNVLLSSHDNQVEQRVALSAKEQARDIYITLTKIIAQKSCLPNEQVWSTWGKQTRTTFKSFRRDLADTLVSCFYIIGNEIFSVLLNLLTPESTWMEVESVYFCSRAVADSVCEGKPMSDMIEHLFKFAFTNFPAHSQCSPALRQSIILFMGAYSPWLHDQSPDLIISSVSYLVPTFDYNQSLTGVDLATASFRAFKQICDSCSSNICPQIDNFVQLFLSNEVDSLSSDNRVQFAESLGEVIKSLPVLEQRAPLLRITEFISGRIRNFLNANNGYQKLLDEFSCLGSIIRTVQLKDEDDQSGINIPVSRSDQVAFLETFTQILGMIWPSVEAFGERAILSDDISLGIQNFLESLVCTFKIAGGEPEETRICSIFIIPSFTEQFVGAVMNLCYSCFLKTSSFIWIDLTSYITSTFGYAANYSFVYSNEEKFRAAFPFLQSDDYRLSCSLNNLLGSFVQQITNAGYNLLLSAPPDSQNLAESLDNSPDLAESLISLWSRVLKNNPHTIILGPDNLIKIVLGVGLSSLKAQHSVTFKVGVNFWIAFLSLQKGETSAGDADPITGKIRALLDSLGEELCQVLVDGILYLLPRSSLSLLTDLFSKFMLNDLVKFRVWLRNACNSEPTSTKWQHVPPIYREQFQRQIVATRGLKKIKEIIRDLAVKARGLEGTAFAQI